MTCGRLFRRKLHIMTRINVGIDPHELCDQHLIAEAAKELPRIYRYMASPPYHRAPATPRLGTGHVLWCGCFIGSIARRHVDLVSECRRRGIMITRADPPPGAFAFPQWTVEHERAARVILIQRIRDRLGSMRSHAKGLHHPRWSKGDAPDWAL